MALGDVRRGAVESLPLRKRQAQSSQTVDTYFQAPEPVEGETRASRVVQGLFNFSGKALDFSARQEKQKIELDKVTQQQRALQGLDPTDDATKAGIRAYQIVNIRDSVLSTNAELAQTIRENPDMTDEEYELATRRAYAPLLEQYQSDAQLSQALSNRLQESQVQVHQIRAASQREHRDWQRQESFKESIEAYREAASSPGELADMVNGGQLESEASALGITPAQYRTGLIQMAQMDADQGDGRLLQAIKTQEWASRDERVQKAQEVYEEWDARNNAVEIGTQWGAIQEAWVNRSASWAQTSEAIRRVNERFPGSIGANQVASLRQRAARAQARDTEKKGALAAFWQSQGGDRPVRLGTNPLIPNEHREYIINQTAEQLETMARTAQASGEMTPEQAEAWVLEEKLKFGRQQGIEMPGISPVITSLANEDPGDWGGEGIPTYFMPALRAIPMMNESDIEQYGKTEREKNMMRMYQRFLSQDSPDPDAWRRSYNSVQNASALDPEERSTLVDNASATIDESLSRSWWQFGQSSVPEGLRSTLRANAREEAMSLIGTGGLDYETAGKVGAERAMNSVTVMDNGSYINRNTQQLLRDAAFADAEGNQYQLQENDITPAFEQFFNSNLDSLRLESFHGESLDIKKTIFEVTPGGLVMVRDDMGEPLLDAPVNLRNITKDYIDSVSTERAASANERAERRAERERRDAERVDQYTDYMNIAP